MIQVVIPAAGDGTRFREAGYDRPKPLIDVCGVPMIQRVMDNLQPKHITAKMIVIHKLQERMGAHQEVILEKPTRGAVDTLFQAYANLEGDQPLLIANCDQLVAFDVNDFIDSAKDHDGAIVTFKSNKPHHSYVKTNNEGIITEIVEKEVISNQAVTGVYYFNKADDFFADASIVLAGNIRVKGEFYVSTVLDRMIKDGYELKAYEAPSAMLGTPEELQLFIAAVEVSKTL